MADTASRTLNELRKKIQNNENSISDGLENIVPNKDTSQNLEDRKV